MQPIRIMSAKRVNKAKTSKIEQTNSVKTASPCEIMGEN